MDNHSLAERVISWKPIIYWYNSALVCHRWRYLACHPRLWLRVDRSVKHLSDPRVFPNIEIDVATARPRDTILIAAGGEHVFVGFKYLKCVKSVTGREIKLLRNILITNILFRTIILRRATFWI
ncbi:hypothetical protein UlMin_005004 [Ulmus minor]